MMEFLNKHWRDGIEIFMLAAIAYHGYHFFRATRGARILTGLLVLLLSLTATSEFIELRVINWLLQRPTVANVIVGARDESQLRENLGAVGWTLTAAQIAALDAASATTKTYPYWHQADFGERNPSPV